MSNLATNLSGGGSGGGTWSQTAFATLIPFDRTRYMPQQVATTSYSFTVKTLGAVPGGSTTVRLIADGVAAPSFVGMVEAGSSMGYDNRAGVVNLVTFFYDGVDYWYSIMQAAGAVAAAGVTQLVRLTNLGNSSESGDGSNGWNYTAAGVSSSSAPDKSLASGADGWFRATVGTRVGSANSMVTGFSSTSVNSSYTTILYGIFVNGSTGKYIIINSNSFPTPNGNANVTSALGDMKRARRAGTSVIMEVSQDAGATWTTIHTFSGASTAQLFPCLGSDVAAVMNNLRGSGLS